MLNIKVSINVNCVKVFESLQSLLYNAKNKVVPRYFRPLRRKFFYFNQPKQKE